VVKLLRARRNVADQQYPDLWKTIILSAPDRTSPAVMRYVRFVVNEDEHARQWTTEENHRLLR
jgi:hypothetical protein